MTAPQGEKPFETKLAHLIRMLGTEHEGEAIAAWGALRRLLASRNVTFTDLGDAVEKLATGGLEEAEMKRLYEAGRAAGARDAKRTLAEAESPSASAPTARPTGRRSRSIASARRPASAARRNALSSTTWPRA